MSQDGSETTVKKSVHKVYLEIIVPSPAHAFVEHVILTTAPVNVHLVSTVPCARSHAPVDGMALGVVYSVFAVMALLVIMNQDSVDVLLVGQV